MNENETLERLLFLDSYHNQLKGFFYSNLGWQKDQNNQIRYMFLSYVESCERLYDSIKDGNDSDEIIFPLLFLIRHTVELGMKELTYFLKQIKNSEENNHEKVFGKNGNGHDLSKLLDALRDEIEDFDCQNKTNIKQQLENMSIGCKIIHSEIENSNTYKINDFMYETFKDSNENFFDFLDEFVEVFNKIDSKSFSFRYPTDRVNNKSLANTKSINISFIYGIFLQLTLVFDVFNFQEVFFSNE